MNSCVTLPFYIRQVAGSSTGITAIQLDVKLSGGVPLEILEAALDQARDGRLKILSHMEAVLGTPRLSTKPHAPQAELVRFEEDQLRHLLGPGGEMIKYIRSTFDCVVEADEPGEAYIFGTYIGLWQSANI